MITYRTATRPELDLMLNWAASEGWNPGLEDADAFWAADPNGFFVAVDDEMPVASISVVNHSDTFAFLGLYIVKPSYRGRGVGYQLWQHALHHAGHRTVGLDGVPEQQENYASSGFAKTGGTTRFSGEYASQFFADVRLSQPSDVPTLIAREANVTGASKKAFLSSWFSNTETRKTLLAERGFCTVRKCRDGAKIGPLLAEDADTADQLLKHAAALFGPEIVIDVPVWSDALTELCERSGLVAGFQTARMYLGQTPEHVSGIFAVTSLELG